jgi:hypothetical protein
LARAYQPAFELQYEEKIHLKFRLPRLYQQAAFFNLLRKTEQNTDLSDIFKKYLKGALSRAEENEARGLFEYTKSR